MRKERVYILQTMQHFLFIHTVLLYYLCTWATEKWVVFNFHIKFIQSYFVFGTLPVKQTEKWYIQICIAAVFKSQNFSQKKILGENICTCNLPDIMLNGTTTSFGKCERSKKIQQFYFCSFDTPSENSFHVENSLKEISKYQKATHWNQISEKSKLIKNAIQFCSGLTKLL